jgi:glycosyltransferase involved in cell wall biosynthesis
VKILHVTPNVSRAYGGPTYSLVGYSAAGISASGEVTVAAPRPPESDVEWLTSQLSRTELKLFTGHGRNAFIASPALHAWMRTHGSTFDVVHVHGLLNPISSLASRLCIRRRWPIVIRPFGTLSSYTLSHRRSALKKLYFSAIERPTLRRTSALHFTTTAERDEASGHGISWGSRAFVIPPPVGDLPRVESRAPRTTSNVVVIARLNPVKHLEVLLDAWPLVLQRIPAARLAIAGDGDPAYVRSLRQRAATMGDSVRFVGTVDNARKQSLLEESDLFVLPSLHENFGMAVLEAIGAGLPVVITPEVQLSSFVTEHRLGLIAEGSACPIAGAMIAALSDQALRARCFRDGAPIVSHFFSRLRIGEQLLEMYAFATAHPPCLAIA